MTTTDPIIVSTLRWPAEPSRDGGGQRVLAVVTLLVAACTMASLCAAVLGWIGWRGAGPLPTNGDVNVIMHVVAPAETVTRVERADHIFGDAYGSIGAAGWVFGDDDYGSGYVWIETTGAGTASDRLADVPRPG